MYNLNLIIYKEIQHLTESYSALKLAQTKFNTNIDCINTVKKLKEGKYLMFIKHYILIYQFLNLILLFK